MPHYCRHCERYLANERFTGRGHHQHLCKECSRRPKGEIQKADQLREIASFLKQSHISSKNCERLAVLTKSGDKEVSQLAELVGRVASICPYKRRRLKNLARKNRELIRLLEEAGLIFPSFRREYGDEWGKDLDSSLDVLSESDFDSLDLLSESDLDSSLEMFSVSTDAPPPADDDEPDNDELPF
jgi:hypothetical protein